MSLNFEFCQFAFVRWPILTLFSDPRKSCSYWLRGSSVHALVRYLSTALPKTFASCAFQFQLICLVIVVIGTYKLSNNWLFISSWLHLSVWETRSARLLPRLPLQCTRLGGIWPHHPMGALTLRQPAQIGRHTHTLTHTCSASNPCTYVSPVSYTQSHYGCVVLGDQSQRLPHTYIVHKFGSGALTSLRNLCGSIPFHATPTRTCTLPFWLMFENIFFVVIVFDLMKLGIWNDVQKIIISIFSSWPYFLLT